MTDGTFNNFAYFHELAGLKYELQDETLFADNVDAPFLSNINNSHASKVIFSYKL